MSMMASLTDDSRTEDVLASPTPSGSRSGTPASMDGPATSNKMQDAITTGPSRAAPGRSRLGSSARKPLTSLTSDNTSTAPPSSASNTDSKDAEDFFARAQAMGLRLTREDYERTKAGVAAFLKAERPITMFNGAISAAAQPKSAQPATVQPAASSSTSTVANPKTPGGVEEDAKLAEPSSSQVSVSLARASGPAWSRNISSPGLSFFTTVVKPDSSSGASKVHPSLDEVGSAEEKRRLQMKKTKLRERRERQRSAIASSNKPSQLLGTPTSNAAQSSPETGSPSFRTSPVRGSMRKISSGSIVQPSAQVGLGLEMDESDSNTSADPTTPPEGVRARGRTVSFGDASPVVRVSDEVRQCATLEDLSRRAWVSPRGTLRLLRSPMDEDAVFSGSPVDKADDSGTFTDNDDIEATARTIPHAWAHNHRRTSSVDVPAAIVADSLNAKMNRLNFLDQVMAQKSSPRRLYKEAKERRRQDRLLKQAEEVQRTEARLTEADQAHASTASEVVKTANPDYASLAASTPLSTAKTRKVSDAAIGATPLNASSSKALRWSSTSASPGNLHMRMTTREHYDFTMHGISPGGPSLDSLDSLYNIHSTPGPITFSAWDAEPLTSLRKGTDGRPRTSISGPSTGHILFGDDDHPELIGVSPSVASFFHARQGSAQGSAHAKLMRSASEGVAVMSPLSGRLVTGVASGINNLDFDTEDPVHIHDEQLDDAGKAFNAKRGLLFGSSGDAFLEPNDIGGPLDFPAKLVRLPHASPARVGRPLRGGAGGDEMISGRLSFASPRSSLVRAQSSSVLEARRERQPSESIRYLLGGVGGHRRSASRKSFMDTSDTISPADVFGSSLPRAFASTSVSMAPPFPEPSKFDRAEVEAEVVLDFADEKLSKMVPRRARSLSPQSPSRAAKSGSVDEASAAVAYPAQLEVPVVPMMRSESAEPVLSTPQRPPVFDHADQGLPFGASLPSQLLAPQGSTKKSKKSKAGGSSSSTPVALKIIDLPSQNFEHMTRGTPSIQNGEELGWDQPDGSRLVKLVSEELKAALENGTLTEEPPARYYLLPIGYGQSKAKPASVSYAGLIGQAIKSSSDMRLSLSEIYEWISCTYPFFEKGDRGWQNSIRHNLSLNKSFLKIERENNMPGKGGWWGIKTGHEDRFQNGLYNAAPQKFEAKARQQANQDRASPLSTPSMLNTPLASHVDTVSQSESKSDSAAKRRTKAKRKKTDGAADESGNEDASPMTKLGAAQQAKRNKTDGTQDRFPLSETQLHSANQAHMMALDGSDTVTPIRPHSDPSIYGSSTAGSQYSKSVPMLTHSASSPPSSPVTLMPPPSMQMTADHSARKRKMAGPGNGQLGFGTGFSPSLYGAQPSPLHAARNGAYRNMRGSALGGAFTFSAHGDSDSGRGSPLRRQNQSHDNPTANSSNSNSMATSPKRLWSMSSPTSSMRGSMQPLGGQKDHSSARVAAALAHSPMRGSPLRGGAAGSPNSSIQMQMAMVGGQGGYGNMSFAAGLGMGNGLAPGRTPGSLRYPSGFSPVRRGLAASMTAQPPQMMAMSGQTQQGWYLDDPFEMQANMQQMHHHHQQQQHHHHLQQQAHAGQYQSFGAGDGVSNSPLRMAWNSIQAAGGIQAFTGNTDQNFSQTR